MPKNHERRAFDEGFRFSPREVSFVGTSGAGKTTLVCRLTRQLAPRYRVGYIKHNAHRIEMDREGKDTWRARQSGASDVLMGDGTQAAWLHDGEVEEPLAHSLFQGCDIVLVEGYRRAPELPKVVVLDPGLSILEEIKRGDVTGVIAYVRPHDREVAVPESCTPLFQPDDAAGISAFILRHLRDRALQAPLYGLVLSGGASKRMQRDKAALAYHGLPQVQHAAGLLASRCTRVFVSTRAERAEDPLFRGLEQIHDTFVGFGPMGGLLSAFHAHPAAAWLVLGCDLPFVTAATLDRLLAARDPLRHATAYRSPEDGLPEPLCALYEPPYRRRLLQIFSEGRYCPRKALIASRAHILESAGPGELDNVNDPAQYEQAVHRLKAVAGTTR